MKNLYLILLFVTAAGGAQVVNIPDASLKATLIFNGYDTNSDGLIQQSEADAVVGTMNLNNGYFSDLTGLSSFNNVTNLYCNDNAVITTVSLSGMPNLKAFHCQNNANLTTVNISNMVALDTLKCNSDMTLGLVTNLNINTLSNLKYLDCSYNKIQILNLAPNPQLKNILCSNNWFYLNGGNGLTIAPNANIEELDCSNNQNIALNYNTFPSLKTLNCGGNGINLNISGLLNLETLRCGNSQMTTLTLSNLPVLKNLSCSGNFLTSLDLSPFPTLQYVGADGNHFTSLNVTGLTNLTYLSCALAQLPALNVSTLTALTYLNCYGNQMTSLNLSNLPNLHEVHCGNEFLTSVNIANTPMLDYLDCENTAVTAIDLTGHAAMTKLYCGFNTNLANPNLSLVPNLQTLHCSGNGWATLDVTMLPALSALYCDNNALTTLDCSNNHSLTWLTLYANQLETLFIKNGANEFFDAANWTENPTLQYICADDSQIAAIQTAVGTGVSVNSYCSFIPGAVHNTIAGTVRFDGNNNGCDALDVTPPLIKVTINDGVNSGSTFTSANSDYSFFTGAGEFMLAPDLENAAYFDLVLPADVIFPTVNNSISTQNFCIAANGVHPDLEIVISPVVAARPGFDAVYKIVYKNKGNQVMSSTNPMYINFGYNPDQMSFVQADVTPASQTANMLGWSYNYLTPFESRSFLVTMHIHAPTDTNPVNVNDMLQFTAQINPVDTDETQADNNFDYHQTVVGSLDPNNITCIEGGVVSPTAIGDYLHYIINFENTGTDEAQNIVIADMIDLTQFDISSLRILNSSDPVDARITGNKAEFIFKDIHLEIGGHGNILLKMKSKSSLVVGDVITNKADIFFDYNLPVATNQANTTFQALSVNEHEFDNSIGIYPNPTHDILNVKSQNNIKSIQLFDVQGRILQTSMVNENMATIDISGKQSGIYFLKITSDKGIKIEKVVKN